MTIPLQRALALSLLLAPASAQGIAYEWSLNWSANSAASAGDVDGDGAADFAIAKTNFSGGFGHVEVRSGSNGGLLWAADGAKSGDGFGATLTGLGDVDGDGFDDLAVAAPNMPLFGLGPPPYVRVLSGVDGSILWEATAATAGEMYGKSLARIADLDGDGSDDLIVGSTFASKVQVRSGANGALVLDISPPQGASYDFGTCVAALGDLDGDGRPDLGVGDPGFQSGRGRISLHSGLDGGVLFSIGPPTQGPPPSQSFGNSFDGLGDVSADGIPDLVAGDPGASTAQSKGLAWVLSGADGAVLHELAPEAGSLVEGFGMRVAGTEDVDGDGVADVRLCAGSYLIAIQGEVHVYVAAELRTYSGGTGALLQRWPGLSSPAIAAVPDANGDGRSDVLVVQGGVSLVLDGLAQPHAWASCPGKASSNGCVPMVTIQGTPSLTQFADLELHVSKLPVGALGVCLYGPSSATLPFGSGVLCVAPPFLRKPMQPPTLFANSCSGLPSAGVVCPLTKPDLAALGLAPGDGIYVQAWFRDTGAPPPDDFGLSGALSIQLWP